MFFVLFAYFSQAKKHICVCKGECSSLCTKNIFNASTNSSFLEFFNKQIINKEEIEIDFYSKHDEFTFSIDISMFGSREVTLKALQNSNRVFLQIRDTSKRKQSTVTLDANYKIVLPSLIPFPDTIHTTYKKVKRANAPSSSNIPISIGMHQMSHQGEARCLTRTGHRVNLSALSPSTSQANCGCPSGDTDLEKATSYQCGYQCWGLATYEYTFKGVQFAFYGTSDGTARHVNVQIDDRPPDELKIFSDKVRKNFTLLYTSDILEYKEHHVKISPKNPNSESDKYEIHKFVYWPTLTAKRINASSFTYNADGSGDYNIWKTESDGIGGYRKYRSQGRTAIIKLHCTRFWIYGILDSNLHNITINYNGKTDTNNTRSSRKENTLVYESPEFEYSEITLNIKPSEGTLIIYCIYYEEPPSPIQTPIPVSVNIQQMEYNNVASCSSSAQSSVDIETTKTSGFSCTLQYNNPSAYQCGIKCRGTGMSLSFTFKGVKFGLFGLYNPSFGTINVNLDGKNVANIDANNANFPYANFFESDVYVFKEHTVTISSTGLYEIYKLVFWPSTRASRYNSSDFSYSSGVKSETDRIGGIRHYFENDENSHYYQKTFSCSKFFIYSLTDHDYENVTITFDDKSYSAIQETAIRKDSTMIFESDEFEYKSITLKGENSQYLVLYCVYYHTQPSDLEYVDKTFNITLPYFQILVTPNSNINRISGCNFIHISELFDYFITLEKDISFYDNTFEYSNSDNEKYALPINIHYNSAGSSFLTIRKCKFIQATRKTSNYGANVFYCSREYSINVDFQSCEFEDCGVSSSEMIIQIESQNSHIKMDNCTFQFSQNSCKALSTSCSIATINKCSFIKTGPIIIDQTSNNPSSTQSSNNIAITNCEFDSCTYNDDNCACLKLDIKTTSSITFEYNFINNIKITDPGKYAIEIDGNNLINEITMKNITFTDNSCESLYGGGVGMVIHNIPFLVFNKCYFINNEAKQNTNKARSEDLTIPGETQYFNGDGGGIQIGFYCTLNKAALKFEGCEFKRNKAQRHGGAIAIQTLSTVEISNCIFEENKANADFSTSKVNLFENHFSKKQQGRAGAIYINPTYQYTSNDQNCLNTNDYLKSISITGSQFRSNSAFDGYAIYVEGDQTSTSFVINSNNFNGNYNFDQTIDQNDQNSKVRGVIATEIHTISFDIMSNNEFSDLHSKKLIYVDHYGIATATNIFTYSQEFSKSGYFTKSNDFEASEKFSDSKMFTESDAFSNSAKFSETGSFSLSEKFTSSQAFSKSNDFDASQVFSDSKMFTKSDAFSDSAKFSETEAFSSTEKFTNSQAFSKSEIFEASQIFSSSEKFTNSQAFSNSEKFSKTDFFSKSNEFSLSKDFTSSEMFSNSQAFSKSENFEASQIFSDSGKFTDSKAFSNTVKFTESHDFSTSEKFSNSQFFSNSKEFSNSEMFSNSGKFSETGAFSSTGKFSETQDFSTSEKFSNSQLFSNSKEFSNSEMFSNSGKFSETGAFSNTGMFSETQDFSTSEKFSNSQFFSNSIIFSNSMKFSNSGEFSSTQYFTFTDKFSNTQHFTETQMFSNSQKFTTSKPFTNSNKFRATELFTQSSKFSETQAFSDTSYFSQSNYFTPSSTPGDQQAQCALYIDGEYKYINNCDYVETEGKNTFIDVITSNFTDYQKYGDGSAIHIVNCGFKCNSTYFIDCVSTSDFGSGGAIYINNSVNFEQNTTFIDLYFLRCKAAYGGAVFIYSSSKLSYNSFIRCQFLQNQAYLKKPAINENKNLFGGSGIFAMTREVTILNCSFYQNLGSGVKICNIFDDEKSKLLDKIENTFSIIGCDFEKESNSKSSISFVDENDGNKLNIMNCNFKGKLDEKSHYIDGMVINKDNIKLDSCNFESNENIPLSFELISEEKPMISNQSSRKNWRIIPMIGIFTAILSLYTLKVRIYNDSNEEIFEA